MLGYPRNARDFGQARDELLQASLIGRDRKGKKLVMHRLIQDTVRARIANDEHYSTVYVSVLQLISGVWPYEADFGFIKDETERWRHCYELYRNVLHLKKLSKDNSRWQPPTTVSQMHIQPPKVVLEAAWLSIARADYAETMDLIRLAEQLCEPLKAQLEALAEQSDIKDEFDELQLNLHFHRGALAHHINEPEMALTELTTYNHMLMEKYAGQQTQKVAIGLNDLAVSYLQNNDAIKAEECLRKSIGILEQLPSVTPNTMSMPLINLGFTLWVQGRIAEAGAVFERALAKREQEYGSNDIRSFTLGKLLLGYGNVKAAENKLDESLELYER